MNNYSISYMDALGRTANSEFLPFKDSGAAAAYARIGFPSMSMATATVNETGLQLGGDAREMREAFGPIESATRAYRDIAILPPDLDPVAVVLHFVDPLPKARQARASRTGVR